MGLSVDITYTAVSKSLLTCNVGASSKTTPPLKLSPHLGPNAGNPKIVQKEPSIQTQARERERKVVHVLGALQRVVCGSEDS